MYKDTIEAVLKSAVAKKTLLDESKGRYLLASGLAGAYVGMGIVLIFTLGAAFAAAHSIFTPVVMGMSFGIALTLVIFAGSELSTGNNMVFAISSLAKATTLRDAFRNWLFCYLGNFIGAMILCLLILGTGMFDKIPADHLLFTAASKKMHMNEFQLFFRGIMCNWLVCLAIWTSLRAKEDTAKLLLISWMLFAFIASGYEHSVANMTVLGLALLLPHPDTITIAGLLHNLIPVTLGNIVGGAGFVGMSYWLISPVRNVRVASVRSSKTEQRTLSAAGEKEVVPS
ncbi:formate/nitrite transporter family protein [Paenibacillus sp. MMS18-CY102]|uniref:formate/nitrite transporter family protein n=1 Tax=Paenibacillus sp. MMS18-CY102 TaxID=2682849 RepID=UPI001365D427|nr:formate/nitrite transporter family protein [Paenibacillus sp. MMS18-CY102]MWC30553.1 nitrite transporter NirC [Paenibacillus sp. MMS18-CY102]